MCVSPPPLLSFFATHISHPLTTFVCSRVQWDNSGQLETKELAAALTKLGCKASMDELDTNGDGVISFEEFEVLSAVLEKHSHVVFKQPLMSKCKDLLSADAALIKKGKDVCTRVLGKIRVDDTTLFKEFQKLDDDHDARLTKRELKLIIQKHCPEATSAEKQMMLFTIFSVADVNRDDSISFDEFKAIMQAKV